MLKKIILFFIIGSFIKSQDHGIKAYKKGNYVEAQKYYQTILNKKPNDKNAKFGLGATAYKQNDLESALNLWSAVKNSDNSQLSSEQ